MRRAILTVLACVASDPQLALAAPPSYLEDAYAVEFPIDGTPQSARDFSEAWYEIGFRIERRGTELVFPTPFCLARRIPLNPRGECLVPRQTPDTIVVSVACYGRRDNGVVQALHPDFLGIGGVSSVSGAKCDRRWNDTAGAFTLYDSCLHPLLATSDWVNLEYFALQASGGKPPEDEPLTYSCRWYNDPGSFVDAKIRFEVQRWTPGTFSSRNWEQDQVGGLTPGGLDLGQLLTGERRRVDVTYDNFGLAVLEFDMATGIRLGGPHAADATLTIPRFVAPPSQTSQWGHHAEPPPNAIGMGGRLDMALEITAPAPGVRVREVLVEAEHQNPASGVRPLIARFWHSPVAAYQPEVVVYIPSSIYIDAPLRSRNRASVRNRGGVTATISDLRLTGADAGRFRVLEGGAPYVAGTKIAIAPGETRSIVVEFLTPSPPPPDPPPFEHWTAVLEVVSDSIDTTGTSRGVTPIPVEAWWIP